MNRRKVGAGIAILVVVVGLAVLWKRRGGDGGDGGGASAKAAESESAARAARLKKRIDPKTVERGSIAGKVSDPAGKPIAGATVCGIGYSRDVPEDALREPFCTESGSDGTYQLANLLPASYSVNAQAASFMPATYKDEGEDSSGFKLAAGEAKKGIDLVLRPGGVEVLGVVKDIGGGTVEGAFVFIRQGQRWSDSGGMATVKSAADGTFRAWIGPGEVHVTAQADGYAEGEKEGIAPGQTIEILLTPESVLAGRVVEKGSGAPVPGALVTVGGGWGGWAGGDGEGGGYQAAMSDDDGKFRLTRLSPARYKPTATAAGRYGQAAESVLLGLGQTVEGVVIEVHPASTVKGRVVLSDGKTPCKKGWVALEDAKTKERDHHGMDDAGVVEIEAVLPGTYKVSVDCEGQLSAKEYPELVVVEGKDPPEQLWQVGAGSRVLGVVLSQAGDPVADVQVSVQPMASERGWTDWESDRTGADGKFVVEGLRAGRYKVSAHESKEPAPEKPVEVDVPETGDATVEIRLERGGAVAGQVVDEQGQPVARVTVRARGGKRWGWNERDATQTLDDGTFQIEGVRPGPYRVIASRERWWGGELRAPGKGDDDEQGEKVQVRTGETARVKLVVESQAGVIRGRVVDGSGAAVTDAFVDAQRESESAAAAEGNARMAMRWGWSRTPVLTDTDGKFTVEKLSPGKYTVRAFRKGGGETLAEKVPVGQTVTLTIRQTGSISGTVKTEKGTPPEVMAVAVSDAKTGFRRREQFFRSGGKFTMRDLPAGSFAVAVTSADGTGNATAQLAEGQATTGLAITLGSRAKVTGRLITADTAKPLAGFMVTVMPTGRPQSEMMMGFENGQMPPMSDADGKFEVSNAPAGRVQLMAFPMNMEGSLYAFARKVVTLEGGRETDIGEVKVQKLRAKPDDKPGDFGYELKQPGPDTDMEKMVLTVALVRPGGPAEKAGMKVGDVIISVDGQDVREDPYQYWMLSHVLPGTTVTFGLERGVSVKITAGPPRE